MTIGSSQLNMNWQVILSVSTKKMTKDVDWDCVESIGNLIS